ncbi:MAG: DNA polymerase IV, partial [Gammaproteobacteria bacterium]
MSAFRYWSRMIALVDMNAFFAAIEQRDHPEWRGRPLAVTNGEQGTCIITCSYEARSFGIHTGMRLRQARRLCSDLIQCSAHPHRYAQVSTAIMQGLQSLTPDMEIFSVDEAFLDMTHCQKLWGDAEAIGQRIKQTVLKASGLLCSVGISGDKTTAKYAAKRQKPDGLTIIPPWQAAEALSRVPVTELCGISTGIGNFLAARGVRFCGEMRRLPISVLASRFGNPGRRLWYMCQGRDPDKVSNRVDAPKSIGHGKVMPPNTRDRRVILMFLQHMSEKVAARLRRHGLQSERFFIALRGRRGWLKQKRHCALPTSDGKEIFALCRSFLVECWYGQGVSQVQVTALQPQLQSRQPDLFASVDHRRG